MHEVQLPRDRSRHHERVEVGLAHAARQLVQHVRELEPRVEEEHEVPGLAVVGRVQVVASEALDRRVEVDRGQPEAQRGVEAVDDVQVVRPRLGPVLPRVARRVTR